MPIRPCEQIAHHLPMFKFLLLKAHPTATFGLTLQSRMNKLENHKK